MDTQTTSSHAESGDTVVCNDEAAAMESSEGGDILSVLFLNWVAIVTCMKPKSLVDQCKRELAFKRVSQNQKC